MAKRVRKRNKKRMRAFAVGFVALAFIIAAVLISQQKKLDAIAEEQAQLQEVIAAQNEEKARLEYMIEYSGSESYLIQYAREKLGYVRPDEINNLYSKRERNIRASCGHSDMGTVLFLYYLISNSGGISISSETYLPFFLRWRTHSVSRYSIWPFTERKSSSAHAAIASYSFEERRRGICFLSIAI